MSGRLPERALPASFRDPSGFLFRHRGALHRHVAPAYAVHYDRLMASGLYEALVSSGRLVPHREVAIEDVSPPAYKVLRPEPVPFVSYPYEWSFSQLRDAARLTLDVLGAALDHGMVLKDASAFNVQFLGARPVFIDTLSFETYQEGEPWVGYRQFCQHFLAPLALAAYRDPRLLQLLRVHLDGVPLDLARRLLPRRSWLRFGLLVHLHLHALGQSHLAGRPSAAPRTPVSQRALRAIVASLRSAVDALDWRPPRSLWSAYATEHGYSEPALAHKKELTQRLLAESRPATVWDLGANVGAFSRIAAATGASTVAFDGDPVVTEASYVAARRAGQENLLPLVMDLTNPSPGLGWAGTERESLSARGPADAVLALALVHHLCLANNVPLDRLAEWLASLGRRLIVEFVPKHDPQAQRLLAGRKDVFDRYDRLAFEEALGRQFVLESAVDVRDSARTLYSWRRRS